VMSPNKHKPLRSDARYLRPEQVEEIYGLSRKFLAQSRGRGDGIPYSKAGRRVVLYAVADIEAWLTARRRQSTSDSGSGGE
jgi:predicted DNA-binding transcriptional regulator AlpA